jgi:hypothetical protein
MTILASHYLPSIQYFQHLLNAEKVQIEAFENYQKQTYRNRCYILGANKVELLSIPVRSSSKGEKLPIQAVELDQQQRWRMIHWRTIRSAYGKSPFFVYYEELLKDAFFQPQKYLFEFNTTLLKTILKLLQTNTPIEYTQEFIANYPTDCLDLRDAIPQPNAATLPQKPYRQVFGETFTNNLSILDLLFCKGNQAKNYLLL